MSIIFRSFPSYHAVLSSHFHLAPLIFFISSPLLIAIGNSFHIIYCFNLSFASSDLTSDIMSAPNTPSRNVSIILSYLTRLVSGFSNAARFSVFGIAATIANIFEEKGNAFVDTINETQMRAGVEIGRAVSFVRSVKGTSIASGVPPATPANLVDICDNLIRKLPSVLSPLLVSNSSIGHRRVDCCGHAACGRTHRRTYQKRCVNSISFMIWCGIIISSHLKISHLVRSCSNRSDCCCHHLE